MKFLSVLLLSCLIMLTPEITNAQSKGRPQLNHIAVYVHNLEKSSVFYRDIIGLEEIPEPFKDGMHTWYSLGGQGQLHLIAGASAKMEQFKDRHLCFSFPSVEDFIKTLDKHQIAYSNWKGDSISPNIRPDGIKQIYFRDPDGYWLEVNDDYK